MCELVTSSSFGMTSSLDYISARVICVSSLCVCAKIFIRVVPRRSALGSTSVGHADVTDKRPQKLVEGIYVSVESLMPEGEMLRSQLCAQLLFLHRQMVS